jgi:hypothetical protein
LVFGYSQSAFGYSQSAFGYSQSAFGYSQSAFGYSQSAFGYSQSVFGYSQLAFGYSQLAFGYSQSVSGYSQSVFGCSQSVFGYSQSMFGYSLSARCDKAKHCRPEREYKTQSAVDGKAQVLTVLQKHDAVKSKRRESGKSTTYPDGEKQAQVMVHPLKTLRESKHRADGKTSEDIYRQRAKGK